ncbi:hypothetical protein C475_09949 [Halosimplex carlsbadense 2-9-1]|uniref:Uncharacterized protein n=1 Tax=Halosimplex carlsbadense 2-9-1 TaxID=797114 RepID=M0CSY6_9EURY|nr:DUF6663 family protein [Halosimplex carlsbadense]ELZ25773.1 hypothetical protein C475_09949 [Halosimplex carlsbadense 2-9-1]
MDEGTYRVLPGGDEETWRFFDRDTYETVAVPREGHDAPVDDLQPGYLVDAGLDWGSEEPAVRTLSVQRPTLYTYVADADPVFEVAESLWEETRAAGDGMNATQTYNTDNSVNGVCYVFADSGQPAIYDEFRSGARPIEPLVDRVNDGPDEPRAREVFVLDPVDGAFTVVTITLSKGGRFAETMRETYERDHPDEPLA